MLEKIYDEETKAKYVVSFKKSTLTVRDYAEKMKIEYNDLRNWLKESTDSINFGKINVKELVGEAVKLNSTPTSPINSNGNVNVKLIKKSKIELIKKFNMLSKDFRVKFQSLESYYFTYYFQLLLTYLLNDKIFQLNLRYLNDAVICPK